MPYQTKKKTRRSREKKKKLFWCSLCFFSLERFLFCLFGCDGDSDTLRVTTKKCTNGFTDFEKNISLNLFPNPGSELINLSIEECNLCYEKILLINSLGQETLDLKCTQSDKKIILDISKLPEGIYFLKMESMEWYSNFQKLIIAR